LLRASLPSTIAIHQTVDMECRPILADASQVHQIVMNLCTNAYHAMEDKGGVLTVNLSEETVSLEHARLHFALDPGDYIMLTVADTGCGMDVATKQRIFEPYFTTKPDGKGTGLGLAMVHGIVQSHGGSVTVYSESGKGTEFKVYFPLPTEPVKALMESTAELLRGKGEHILLVDDETCVLLAYEGLLRFMGYEVTSFTSPSDALKYLQAQPERFDVVITDNTMPEMTGPKLTKELLATRPDLPILVVSGLYTEELCEKAKEAGAQAVLAKPTNPVELGEAIREALDRRNAQQDSETAGPKTKN